MSERFTLFLDPDRDRLFHDSGFDIDPLTERSFLEPIVGRCAIANGCFDILHPGHLSVLATLDTVSYWYALRPIVAINSDESIRRIKGEGRPIVPQASRSMLLNHLKWPFTVVVFDEDTPQRLMDILRPQVVIKGAEYAQENVVKWKDSRVISVEMLPGWSTTGIIGDTR